MTDMVTGTTKQKPLIIKVRAIKPPTRLLKLLCSKTKPINNIARPEKLKMGR